MLKLKSIYFPVLLLVGIISCQESTIAPIPKDEADITTLKVELTDTLTGQKLNYYFRDIDDDGVKPPSQWDTIKLSDSSFYKVNLKFINESNPNAVQNITAVIEQDKANRIICLIPNNISATILRTDTDGTYAIGIASTLKTGAVSSGNITITLKNQLGIKNGSCDPGVIDYEVKFPALVY